MQTKLVLSSDTELAVIPSGLLNYIKWRHPRVVSHLIHVLSQKIYGSMQNTLTNGVGLTMPLADGEHLRTKISRMHSSRSCLDEFQDQATALNKNLSTVAIVAASDDVPLDAFTCELVHSLIAIGREIFFSERI